MGRTYSFTECAQKVLEQFGGKKPMHYRSITTKAVEQGWLDSNGLTPDATMYAQIITEIKRKQKRGEPPRFVQHGRGYIGLSRWIGKGLRFQIEEHNKDICKALHKHLMSITPAAFEELIGKLLGFMGFDEPQVTSRNGDGGIDVRGTWIITEGVRIKMAVQVKRWKVNVQAPTVQNVRGSLATEERGLIITTGDFSPGARKEAEDPKKSSPISLINGEQLVRLLVENNIGVTRTPADILELDTEQAAQPAQK
jgi:restriction system protein